MKTAADRFMETLYARTERRQSVESVLRGEVPLDVWRRELIASVRQSIGLWPEPVPLDPREIERKDMGDYTRIRLVYQSEEGLETPAYLLIPKRLCGKASAVVACTGHGYGVREIVGILEDGSERTNEETYQDDFAVRLVRLGMIVLAPEPLGFGEMMLEGDEGSSCYRISSNLLIAGRTILGARLVQFMRAIDLLASMKEVDAKKIGAMGISGGGKVVAFLAMLDERIRAVVVSGYACQYEKSIFAMHHCIDNFPFGLLNYAENSDLMSLVAPRPMLWESGDRDPIFPKEGVEASEAVVRRLYAQLGVPERFVVDYFEGEHRISGRLSYSFLANHLQNMEN